MKKQNFNNFIPSEAEELELLEKAKKFGFYFKRFASDELVFNEKTGQYEKPVAKWSYDNQLGYAIFDIKTDDIVHGFHYELSFFDVEYWFEDVEDLF